MTEEQSIVLTVLADRARRGDGPGSVEEIAELTRWPGARTFGVGRTRRVLRELQAAGHVRRTSSRAAGIRWDLSFEAARRAWKHGEDDR
jgi:hypothetical protein